ncbi:hypothetical protein QLG01_18690 [Acinetobacter sp. V89_4]|uniref:hypothetical protein n=1 Tax=Acinetobacter sp. V89_4 TaxID=3044232 RepID=UPI00249E2D39|nr:hypothetical protein [Acinetobacter sp. V89_4]MDI3455222.1 hypothetical protein [Acinetobacter sp. V89_4]
MNIPTLDQLIQNANTPKVHGEWMVIQWTPDVTTRECFNLGVALDADGSKFLKTIDQDSLSRFACMFGEEILDHVRKLIKISEMAFNNNIYNISDQIKFDKRGPVRGKSGSALVEHLFELTVPLGRPNHIKNKRVASGFTSINLQSLSNNVIDALKFQNALEYDEIVAQSTNIIINDKSIYMPLRPKNKAIVGNWASAVFADVKRVKTDYLQALNDLRTVSDSLKKEPALFILKSTSENYSKLPQSRIDALDEAIDKLDSSLKPQGIKLFSRTSVDELASDINIWYQQAC